MRRNAAGEENRRFLSSVTTKSAATLALSPASGVARGPRRRRQGRVHGTLVLGMLDLEHHDLAAREARRAVVGLEILLQAPDRDLADGVSGRADPAREAMRVEQLQQCVERVVVAVVRRRRQEQPVLAVRRQRADRLRAQRVARVAARRRRPARSCAPRRRSAGRIGAGSPGAAAAPRAAAASPARPSASRSTRSAEGSARTGSRPRRACAAARPSSARSTIRNSRPNFSRISSRHCSCSEAGQTTSAVRARWRSSSSCATRPASIVLPSPTSSAISSVVRGERSARTTRLELVVLDRDPAPERRLQRALIRTRHRAPAHRVEERVELVRGVDGAGRDSRQLGALDHRRARLNLPHHLELLAGRVVLDRNQRDQMLDRTLIQRRLRVARHVPNHPHPPSDTRELTGLRSRRWCDTCRRERHG